MFKHPPRKNFLVYHEEASIPHRIHLVPACVLFSGPFMYFLEIPAGMHRVCVHYKLVAHALPPHRSKVCMTLKSLTYVVNIMICGTSAYLRRSLKKGVMTNVAGTRRIVEAVKNRVILRVKCLSETILDIC